MATYLQSVTDYIPQVQPWTPNFNFYQSVLERKQNKYDQGWQQVNSLYNSILNAPMMRHQNIERRDKFFKDVEEQIDQIASVDLSLPQNVDIANQVFKPFYEDENIVKDIGFTKTYHDEMNLAETYRKCTTKDCKGKYWQGGVRALQHQAADFVNATDDEALRMRNPQYTPYVNFMEKASTAVKDAGLSMKFDSKQGGYIVTTKNGPALQMPLMNFLMNRFGDDPELQGFYDTKAYLITKENPNQARYMYDAAMNMPGAPSEQIKRTAQSRALMSDYSDSKIRIQESKKREDNRFLTLVKRKQVLEEKIKKNGIIPGSQEAGEFNQLTTDIQEQQNVIDKINSYNSDVMTTDQSLSQFGIEGNENQIRSVIAKGLAMSDMQNAAVSLSYKDYERTMRVDKYALEATKHKHRLQLETVKHRNSKDLATHKNILDIRTKQLEYQIQEGIINPKTLQPYTNQNNSLTDPEVYKPGEGETPSDNTAEKLRIEGKPKEGFDYIKNTTTGLTTGWKGHATSIKKDVGGKYMKSILNTASDKANSDKADAAQVELTSLGNELQRKFNKYERYLEHGNSSLGTRADDPDLIAILKLDPETRDKLRTFPSDTKNVDNLNPDYFGSIVNNWDDIITVMGGDNKFYDFIKGGEGVWVPHPETGKSTLKSDIAPKMTDSQIMNLRNKDNDIRDNKYDAIVKGIPYTGPELTDIEKENLKVLDYLENAGSYERSYGLGSRDSKVSKITKDNANAISYLNFLDKSYEKNINVFNNSGEKAFNATKGHYSTNEFNTAERAIANNIWDKGDGTGMGNLKSKEQVFNDLVEQGVKESGFWNSGWRTSIGDTFTPESLTIDQAEKKLGITFTDDNVLRLLAESEYRRKGSPGAFSGYVPVFSLSQDINRILEGSATENFNPNRVTEDDGRNAPALENIYHNRHLLDISREDGFLNVKIKDRYKNLAAGGNTVYKFDINDAEVDDAYWEVLVGDGETAYNNVADHFLQQFQSYDSPIGNEDLGGQMGSFVAPGLSFMVNPKVKDNNYMYAADLIKDGLFKEKISGSGNIDLLRNYYKDFTTVDLKSTKQEDLPFSNISFQPIDGEAGNFQTGGKSKMKITYSDGYLKSLGYNTGKKDGPTMSNTHEYIIEGSESELYKLSTPNPFKTLLMNEGDTYTDNTMSDVGTINYTNVGNGVIKAETEISFFNPETGNYESVALDNQEFSIDNYNWQLQHNTLLDNIKNAEVINNINRQKYIETYGTKNINDLNQQ